MCTTNPTDGCGSAGDPAVWPQVFQDLAREEACAKQQNEDDIAWVELRHRKWRTIHKHLIDNPFTVNPDQPRAAQWRDVLAHCDALFFEKDVTDWLNVQIHIAENLVAGIRDMRPRKNGPCYDVFMEFVRDRKRKYKVTHRWLLDAQAQGAPLTWSVPSQMGAKGG